MFISRINTARAVHAALFAVTLTTVGSAVAQDRTPGIGPESDPDTREDVGIEPGNPAGIETDLEMALDDEDPLAEYVADNEDWDSGIGVNWDRLRHDAREHWTKFSDMETTAVQGRRDALIDLVSDRYELSREDAEREVDLWADGVRREMAGD